MKTKNHTLRAALLLTFGVVLTVTSCNKEQTNREQDGFQKVIIQPNMSVQTRADQPYTPDNGSKIELAYADISATADLRTTYLRTNDGWEINGSTLYWDGLEKKTVSGTDVYPFYATVNYDNLNLSVKADQSSLAAYTESDLLTAYTAVEKPVAQLPITMTHALSQLRVKLIVPASEIGIDLTDSQMTIKSAKTSYTLIFNESSIAPSTATGTGTAQEVTPQILSSNSNAAEFVAILPPQTGDLIFNVTLKNGTTYIYNATSAQLDISSTTLYELSVNKTEIKVNDIKLAEWIELPTKEANIKTSLEGEATDAGTGTGAFNATELKIWRKLKENITEDISFAKDYTKVGGNWTSNDGYYVDDNTNTFKFFATANNSTADAVTSLVDVIGAGPANMGSGEINFAFEHLLSRLKVTIETTDDVIDLSGASITLPNLKQTYEIDYSPSEILTTAATGLASAYTAVSLVSDDIDPDIKVATMILIPQLANGDYVVTLNNGNQYIATLTDCSLEQGKATIIKLSLGKTGIKIGDVAVSEWIDGDIKTSDAATEGIMNPSSQLISDINESGKLLVSTTDNSINIDKVYPIISNGASGFKFSTEVADGYDPLIWEKLTKFSSGTTLAQYIYKTIFVPNAAPITNNEKDYLVGTSIANDWGTSPNFANSNKLTHAMGRVELTIKAGTGYANVDLESATAILTRSKKVNEPTLGSQVITASEIVTESEKSVGMLKPTATSLSHTAIIDPSNTYLGESHVISLFITLNGSVKTYIVKVPIGKTWNIEAGKTLKIEATVNKTDLMIGDVSVTDWIEVDGGDSDIEYQ